MYWSKCFSVFIKKLLPNTNAGGGEGPEVYYSIYGGKGRTYAEAVSVGLSNIFSANRGVKTKQGDHGDYYHVIRETQMPSMLIEYGFIDNRIDAEILKSDANLREMARLTVEAIKRVAPSEATADQYTRNLSLKSPLMYGEDVKRVQKRLNALGFDAGSADGIVGVQTWNKLFDSSANSNELTDEEILNIAGRTGIFEDFFVEFTGFGVEVPIMLPLPLAISSYVQLSAKVTKTPTLSLLDKKIQLSGEGAYEFGVSLTNELITAGISIDFTQIDIINTLKTLNLGFSANEDLTYRIEIDSQSNLVKVIFEYKTVIGGQDIYTSLIFTISYDNSNPELLVPVVTNEFQEFSVALKTGAIIAALAGTAIFIAASFSNPATGGLAISGSLLALYVFMQ